MKDLEHTVDAKVVKFFHRCVTDAFYIFELQHIIQPKVCNNNAVDRLYNTRFPANRTYRQLFA